MLPGIFIGNALNCGGGWAGDLIIETGTASRTTNVASEVHMLYTFSRWPGMSGKANDAVSAYTQVTMSDASRLHKLRETECANSLDQGPWKPWSETLGYHR